MCVSLKVNSQINPLVTAPFLYYQIITDCLICSHMLINYIYSLKKGNCLVFRHIYFTVFHKNKNIEINVTVL